MTTQNNNNNRDYNDETYDSNNNRNNNNEKIHVSVDQKTILNLTSVFPFPADQSRSMDDSERIEEGTAVAMTGTSTAGAGEGVDRTVLVHRIAGIFCTNSFMLGK